jgi:hypothetical protein
VLHVFFGMLVAVDSPTPQPREPLAVVIRSDQVPRPLRDGVEGVERDLARRVTTEDLKLAPVEARVAERGEARELDACPLNNADKIVDVDALVIPNDRHQWGSQGGHYGELRLAIIDCAAGTVTPSNDDTIGQPYENVDRLSPKRFVDAFSRLEDFVIRNLRQP